METDEDRVFKALADASRRRILDHLRLTGGLTLAELCADHEMSRQAVAKHIALLEEAELVVSVRRGREKLHYINPLPIHDIYLRWIGRFERSRVDALRNLKLALQETTDE
jgi:DNA-binding transcriptional ArsR family regulator